MQQPLVSVIIPCYNAAPYIADTIASISAQTHSDWECIIVDDGSTDQSWEIIKDLEAKFAQIQVFKNEGKGACRARNLGISKAKGDYIQFLDADDLLAPNKIAVQIAALAETDGTAVATCDWYVINPKGEEKYLGTNQNIRQTLSNVQWLLEKKTMQPHAWLCPTSIIKATGQWNENLHINQDGEFFYRVMEHTKQVIFCPSTKVYYRKGLANSISNRKRDHLYYNSIWQATSTYAKIAEQIAPKSQSNSVIGNFFMGLVYAAYLEDDQVYRKAVSHPSLAHATIKYPTNNILSKSLRDILGWKNFKKVTKAFQFLFP